MTLDELTDLADLPILSNKFNQRKRVQYFLRENFPKYYEIFPQWEHICLEVDMDPPAVMRFLDTVPHIFTDCEITRHRRATRIHIRLKTSVQADIIALIFPSTGMRSIVFIMMSYGQLRYPFVAFDSAPFFSSFIAFFKHTLPKLPVREFTIQ